MPMRLWRRFEVKVILRMQSIFVFFLWWGWIKMNILDDLEKAHYYHHFLLLHWVISNLIVLLLIISQRKWLSSAVSSYLCYNLLIGVVTLIKLSNYKGAHLLCQKKVLLLSRYNISGMLSTTNKLLLRSPYMLDSCLGFCIYTFCRYRSWKQLMARRFSKMNLSSSQMQDEFAYRLLNLILAVLLLQLLISMMEKRPIAGALPWYRDDDQRVGTL